MSKRNVLIIALVFCLCSMGLAACQPPPQEIKIGVLAILSGEYVQVSGQPTVNAAKLAVQKVNDAGGLDVGGRKYKITLVIEDDANNPETAVAAAKKLINQESIVALVGPQFSKNAIPVADAAEAARIPMISPMSTNPKTTAGKRYVFRGGFIDDFQGQVVARFATQDLGAKKAAVLYDVASDYNRGIAETFKKVFEAAGGQVVAFETYTTGETDFARQLKNIQGSGAGALFLPNYAEEAIAQAKQARQMGINIPLLGSDGWDPAKMSPLSEFEGTFYSGHWDINSTNELSLAFVKAYRQAYAAEPQDTAALTYDAMGLIFHAMQSQGKTDSESIRAGLANTRAYQGVSGTIGYAGTGDPIKSAVIIQIKGGQTTFYKLVNP
jgi:branched-chain amino acid transport system substrate-binding protein